MSNVVYLIVAGVLLGPIEAQEVGSRMPPGETQCIMPSHYVSGGVQCLPPKYESTAETCERAMKEIGAGPKPVYEYLPRPQTNMLTLDGSLIMQGRKLSDWSIAETPVLCIPAPTGMTKR